MSPKPLIAAAMFSLLAGQTMAEIVIHDAYIRSTMPNAPTAAAFMEIRNTGVVSDRLLGVSSDAAVRIELHTHDTDEQGVMRMRHLEEGVTIPAGETHFLRRGGDHVMFMGLESPLVAGESVTITLSFENAGDLLLEVPVDLNR